MADMVSFNVTYDRMADVLYINKSKDAATRTRADDHGIYWRQDSSGHVIGATVLDFVEYWKSNRTVLETALSQRFDVPVNRMRAILDHATEK